MPDKITTSESRVSLPEATDPAMQLELDFSSPQSFVSIIVDRGVKQQTFLVYKQIICHYSQFFRAAFNSPMLEGQTQEMRLEDVDARIFGFFVHWLYTQSATPPYRRCALIDYAKLHSLGDRFMISPLENLAAKLVKYTDPDDDVDSGDSLKDFTVGSGNSLRRSRVGSLRRTTAQKIV